MYLLSMRAPRGVRRVLRTHTLAVEAPAATGGSTSPRARRHRLTAEVSTRAGAVVAGANAGRDTKRRRGGGARGRRRGGSRFKRSCRRSPSGCSRAATHARRRQLETAFAAQLAEERSAAGGRPANRRGVDARRRSRGRPFRRPRRLARGRRGRRRGGGARGRRRGGSRFKRRCRRSPSGCSRAATHARRRQLETAFAAQLAEERSAAGGRPANRRGVDARRRSRGRLCRRPRRLARCPSCLVQTFQVN